MYRPGGTALNSGQVGSTRAAQFISAKRKGEPADIDTFKDVAFAPISDAIAMGEAVLSDDDTVEKIWQNSAKRMSRFGAAIRSIEDIRKVTEEIKEELANFGSIVKTASANKLHKVYRLYDILICQYVYLNAMVDYVEKGGKSRGSALYTDKNGYLPYDNLPDMFKYTLDDGSRSDMVQEVIYKNGRCEFMWRKVREIPVEDDFFENVWRSYRENGNIY